MISQYNLCLNKLNGFSKLENGWFGGEGNPIDENAIKTTKEFITKIHKEYPEVWFDVAAGLDSNTVVAGSLKEGDGYSFRFEVKFYPEDEMAICTYSYGRAVYEFDDFPVEEGLRRFFDELNKISKKSP